jgi:hypothetical protein
MRMTIILKDNVSPLLSFISSDRIYLYKNNKYKIELYLKIVEKV